MQAVERYDILSPKEVIFMDNRGLKNRVAISNAIDKNIHSELKLYSEETGIPISKILDKALESYLKSVKKK